MCCRADACQTSCLRGTHGLASGTTAGRGGHHRWFRSGIHPFQGEEGCTRLGHHTVDDWGPHTGGLRPGPLQQALLPGNPAQHHALCTALTAQVIDKHATDNPAITSADAQASAKWSAPLFLKVKAGGIGISVGYTTISST